MPARRTLLCLALAFAAACGDDAGDRGQTADTSPDARDRPDVGRPNDASLGDDLGQGDDLGDVSEAGEADALDVASDAAADDTSSEPDTSGTDTNVSDAAPTDGPIATDDCEPLGIPTQWSGTFEGDITSNIPDMGGYTFQGPVQGAIRFEIWCINQKLVVLGELDGGSTNCALASGCPFTARLDGEYNPETRHMEGRVLDAVIDYTMVQVYAEGVFEGDLLDGTLLSGVWSGEKTGISSSALEWVEASGVGTWEASPIEP